MVTAGLEHPGIVSLHEYRQGAGAIPFYVMRLVRGKTLGERIREYHQPPAGRPPLEQHLLWERLLQSLASVCDAISFAHENGILHRDLKPGNVILGEFGEVVVLDWGMARRLSKPGEFPARAASGTDPADETIVGTPDYMPPEQANGHADVRSEVFGLGAILYEMLTGRSPHGWAEGARPAEWSRLVQEACFEHPRRLSPATPRPLEAICMKALSQEPGQRYQTAAELARELRCYLAGEPVSAWQEAAMIRAWRRLRGRH
jgi:serine/threonine-protein kinase